LCPGAGELNGTGVTQEQADPDVVLKRLDLPGDRALGQRQVIGGSAKAQVPGHGLKGAQVAQAYRTGAQSLLRGCH
jgi:hypothetical protein